MYLYTFQFGQFFRFYDGFLKVIYNYINKLHYHNSIGVLYRTAVLYITLYYYTYSGTRYLQLPPSCTNTKWCSELVHYNIR